MGSMGVSRSQTQQQLIYTCTGWSVRIAVIFREEEGRYGVKRKEI